MNKVEQKRIQLTQSSTILKAQVASCSALMSTFGNAAKTPAIGPTGPVVVPALATLVPILNAQAKCMESIAKLLESMVEEF